MKKHLFYFALMMILFISLSAADFISNAPADKVDTPDYSKSETYKPGVRDGSFPKIAIDLFNENFEGGVMPTGWIVVDGLSDSHTWIVTNTFDAGTYPPNYGTYFAAYNESLSIASTEELWTPSISTAGIVDTLFVRYDFSFQDYAGNGDMWTIVRRYSGGVWSAWDTLVTRTVDTAGSDTFNLSIYVPADSIQVGWVYTQTASTGWGMAVDNVQITTDFVFDYNLRSDSILTPASEVIAPAPFTPSFMLTNTGSNNAFDYWVYFYIEDTTFTTLYYDSMLISDTLLPDSSVQVNFINQQFSPAYMTQYTAISTVSLAADTYSLDDQNILHFRTYDLDVGCDTIYSPTAAIDPAADIPVSGNFHNFATQAATFDCYVIIRDNVNFPVYTDNFHIDNLAPGADTTVDFKDWLMPHAIGDYTVYMFSKVANDLDASNDTTVLACTSSLGGGNWIDMTGTYTCVPTQWPGYCQDDMGHLYVVGGLSNSVLIPEVQVFDSISGWTVLDSLPTPCHAPSVSYYDGKLYIIGGADAGFNAINATQIYDIGTDTWSAGTPPPSARAGCSGSNYNGKMYIVGGLFSGSFPTDCPTYEYNPAADTTGGTPWTQMTDCPRGTDGLAFGSGYWGAPGNGYQQIFVGGDYRSGSYNVYYTYDPTADTAGGTPWTTITTPPADVGGKNPMMVWNDTMAYIWGGDVNGSWSGPYSTAAYEYDIATDTWTDFGSDLNTGMEGAAAGFVGEWLLTFGGTIGSGAITPAPFERAPTITVADYQAPYMTYTNPAHTAVNVALTAPVIIGFNEPIDTSAGFTFTCTPNPGLLTPVWNATLDTVTIYHNDFTFDVDYYIEITSAYDNAGWELITRSIPNPFGFSTGATGIDDNAKKTNTFYISANRNIINDHAAFLFSVPSSGRTEIEIFNVLGEKVATVLDDDISAGTHTATWDLCNSSGRTVSSGVYLYKITSGDRTATGKLTLIK